MSKKRTVKDNGAKPKYDKFEEMSNRIYGYFFDCENLGEIPSLAGLLFALGIQSRQTLLRYQNSEKFGCLIKDAKMYILKARTNALDRGVGNASGHMLAIKQLAMNLEDDPSEKVVELPKFKWAGDDDKGSDDSTTGGKVVILNGVELPED